MSDQNVRRAGDDDFRSNAAAHAVANHVIRRQAERIDQRHDVLDHVAQAEGGVHRQRLGIAVAAHVGGDGPEAGGKGQHGLLPEGGGSAVAVNEKHGSPPAGPHESTCMARRGVWIIWEVIPGRVGIELIAFSCSS